MFIIPKFPFNVILLWTVIWLTGPTCSCSACCWCRHRFSGWFLTTNLLHNGSCHGAQLRRFIINNTTAVVSDCWSAFTYFLQNILERFRITRILRVGERLNKPAFYVACKNRDQVKDNIMMQSTTKVGFGKVFFEGIRRR